MKLLQEVVTAAKFRILGYFSWFQGESIAGHRPKWVQTDLAFHGFHLNPSHQGIPWLGSEERTSRPQGGFFLRSRWWPCCNLWVRGFPSKIGKHQPFLGVSLQTSTDFWGFPSKINRSVGLPSKINPISGVSRRTGFLEGVSL